MFRSTPAAAARSLVCSDFRRRRKRTPNDRRRPRLPGERSRDSRRTIVVTCAMAGSVMQTLDFDHRQRRAAVHAGLAVGLARPGQLGADVLHRRRRDHDRAGRLDRRPLRPQAAVRHLHGDFTIASVMCGLSQDLTQMVMFRLLQGVPARRWCRCRSRWCIDSLSRARARQGAVDLRHGHHAGPDHGPDARRVADRTSIPGTGCSSSTCRSASSRSVGLFLFMDETRRTRG